jgi:hypothetical protein
VSTKSKSGEIALLRGEDSIVFRKDGILLIHHQSRVADSATRKASPACKRNSLRTFKTSDAEASDGFETSPFGLYFASEGAALKEKPLNPKHWPSREVVELYVLQLEFGLGY